MNATIGIIVCDQTGIMVSANSSASEMFGYPTAALLGQLIEVVVPDAAGHH